jgi:uncharacterized protein
MLRHTAWLALFSPLLLATTLFAQFPSQKPEGYVNDIAGVLTPAKRQQLETLCADLDHKANAQLAIVTVRSLEGRRLAEFTIDLATKWGIGPKRSNRGVMLFLTIEDRRSRIEVGYGLEPILTDLQTSEILRSMTPLLRNVDYDGATQLGATTIARAIADEAKVKLSIPSAPINAPTPTAPREQGGPDHTPDHILALMAMLAGGVLLLALAFIGVIFWRLYFILIYTFGLVGMFPTLSLSDKILITLLDVGITVAILVPPFWRFYHNRSRRGSFWTDFLYPLWGKEWKKLSKCRRQTKGFWIDLLGGGSGRQSSGGFGGFGGGSFGGGGASDSW